MAYIAKNAEEQKALDECSRIASQWTSASNKRICAICLNEVDRETYNRHMQSTHGYETLEITYNPPVRLNNG